MDKYEREKRRNKERRPLTMRERWRLDGESLRKSDPEYYDSEHMDIDLKKFIAMAKEL